MPDPLPTFPAAKAIAFYLPQFHPIPENDRWWGKGFTEWNNVRAARSQFPGHYQPHEPHPDLGWYDLRHRTFLRRQHALAARYGLHGFCYYYYYFDGLTPLEKPLLRIRQDQAISLPYCLCWANGHWTRTWYGQPKEVLLRNTYAEDHMGGFFEKILPYLMDPRYIRVEGKPLLLVYQAENIPQCPRWADLWRRMAQSAGLPGLYLAQAEALSVNVPPADYGFDAAVEFAPDWSRIQRLSLENSPQKCCDYRATATAMLQKALPPYTRFPGVFPSWDNTPRYGQNSVVFLNSGPGAFRAFLEAALRKLRAAPLPEPLLFINAWNEWGEGCHLEPDKKYGYAWLQALKDALDRDCGFR